MPRVIRAGKDLRSIQNEMKDIHTEAEVGMYLKIVTVFQCQNILHLKNIEAVGPRER